jgi:hypothetical protein
MDFRSCADLWRLQHALRRDLSATRAARLATQTCNSVDPSARPRHQQNVASGRLRDPRYCQGSSVKSPPVIQRGDASLRAEGGASDHAEASGPGLLRSRSHHWQPHDLPIETYPSSSTRRVQALLAGDLLAHHPLGEAPRPAEAIAWTRREAGADALLLAGSLPLPTSPRLSPT